MKTYSYHIKHAFIEKSIFTLLSRWIKILNSLIYIHFCISLNFLTHKTHSHSRSSYNSIAQLKYNPHKLHNDRLRKLKIKFNIIPHTTRTYTHITILTSAIFQRGKFSSYPPAERVQPFSMAQSGGQFPRGINRNIARKRLFFRP